MRAVRKSWVESLISLRWRHVNGDGFALVLSAQGGPPCCSGG